MYNLSRMSRKGAFPQTVLPVLAILLLATAMRFYHLGDKSLWGDEIAQAQWSAWGWAQLWGAFRQPPDFILQFVLIHLSQFIGASEFWVRLPSAALSLLAVPATYVVARRMTNQVTALLAMLFISIAPYQIWYAQEARMYAALCFYAILSLYFFMRLIGLPAPAGTNRNTIWTIFGLTVANVLGLYNHLFGVFPILIESAAVAGIVVAEFFSARRLRSIRPALWFAVSIVLTAILALPLLPGTLPYVLRGAAPALPSRIAPAPTSQLTLPFLIGLVDDFGWGAGDVWRTVLPLALAMIGIGVLARRNWRAAWIALLWLALPPFLLWIAHPRHDVISRYLIFMQPVYLILAAYGVMEIVQKVWGRLGTIRTEPVWQAAVIVAGVIALAVIVAPPLNALYHRAPINDWRAVAQYLERRAEPGDIIVSVKDTWGMNALAYYLPNLLRYSTPPSGVDVLKQAVSKHRRLWYVSLGGSFDAASLKYAQENLTTISPTDWQRVDLNSAPNQEFDFPESESAATIHFLDGEIPSRIIYYGRQGFSNNDAVRVRINPGETLESKLLLDSYAPRLLQIEYTSRQPSNMRISVDGSEVAHVQGSANKKGVLHQEWQLPKEVGPEMMVRVTNSSNAYPLFVRSLTLRVGEAANDSE